MATYHSRGDRIADLILRQGDVAAQGAQQSGQIWGGAVQQLGGIAAGATQQVLEERQAKEQAAKMQHAFDSVLQQWDGKDPRELYRGIAPIVGPEAGLKMAAGMASLTALAQKADKPDPENFKLAVSGLAEARKTLGDEYVAKNWQTIRQTLGPSSELFLGGAIPEEYTPQIGELINGIDTKLNQKGGEGFTLGAGQVRFGPDGQQIAAGPAEAPKPAQPRVVGRSLVDETGKVIYRDPETRSTEGEPLVPIIGPDGEPVLVPRSQAAGKRPASTREQGRPVTSGDAGRIADLDTSLNDLKTLTSALGGSKATGVAAKAGAALPNFITEWTGVGADAKSKQAVIDRVKQVIGKALEGGVLRKEDEYKYEKILPTIGDPPDLVTSKLTGLQSAIAQRRQVTLDSLSDAGYNVSKYEQRGASQGTVSTTEKTVAPKTIGRFKVEVE
jgi:hypothetical protein